MYPLSQRVCLLRNHALNAHPGSDMASCQREYYFTVGSAEAARTHKGDNGFLTAAGTAAVILNASAEIETQALLTGHNYSVDEYFIGREEQLPDILRACGFTEAEVTRYAAAKQVVGEAFTTLPDPGFDSDKQSQLNEEMAAMGGVTTNNHTVIGYAKVLELGFEGLLKQLEAQEEPGNSKFYAPLKLLCRAACSLGDKYAQKATELMHAPDCTPERQAELRQIATVCSRVPRKPARNFWEAVQSLWFAHMINTWEDHINANSIGRLDQILYPYYEADIASGAMTRQQAYEIVCLLWLKLYREYDVQQSCVGGCDAAGNPAVNELSYLMLDATEALGFVRCLSVRYDAKTEKAFVQRALEVVGRNQNGIPFFFNDDVMIPALIREGIAPEDARDYTQIGCVETVIPGRSNPHAVTARVNMLKAMEYALANGRSCLDPGYCPGVETGEPNRFTSYDALLMAVQTQLRHLIDNACDMTAKRIPVAAINAPTPYKTLLTDDCLARARDFNNQGARYDFYQIMLLGIPNLADSLAAIRELVYGRRAYTLSEIIWHLENNFPDESVRMELLNKAPKYGNDIAAVDQIAYDILNFACDCIQKASERVGYHFHPQPFTYLWMTDHGARTAATPDGRRNGEILAYSMSPMQGRDSAGLTALLNSLSRLPTTRTAGTTSAIVEAEPALFEEGNISRLADIMLAAAGQGLSNVQFNIVDEATLRDAQRHPERHRNLAVRVSGFSHKFCLLDKALQDHIISRTKHASL